MISRQSQSNRVREKRMGKEMNHIALSIFNDYPFIIDCHKSQTTVMHFIKHLACIVHTPIHFNQFSQYFSISTNQTRKAVSPPCGWFSDCYRSCTAAGRWCLLMGVRSDRCEALNCLKRSVLSHNKN